MAFLGFIALEVGAAVVEQDTQKLEALKARLEQIAAEVENPDVKKGATELLARFRSLTKLIEVGLEELAAETVVDVIKEIDRPLLMRNF